MTIHFFCFIILANFFCFNTLASDKRGESAISSSEASESKRRKLEKSYSSNSDMDEDSTDAAWNAEEDPDFGETDEFNFEQPKMTQTAHNAQKVFNENFKEIIDALKIAGLTEHELHHIKNSLEQDKRHNFVEFEQLKNIVNILIQPSSIRNQTPRDAIIRHFAEFLQIHIPPEKALSDDASMAPKIPNTLDQSSDDKAAKKDIIIDEEIANLNSLQHYLRLQNIDEILLQKTMEYCAQFSPQKITDIMSIPPFDLSRRLRNLVTREYCSKSSPQKESCAPESFGLSFGDPTNDSPGPLASISQLMALAYRTSNSAQPIEKQHPLIARLIELGLLPLKESNTNLACALYYPTKAFASLNVPIIIEAPISFKTNVGIKNANGNDCWLIALLQSFYTSKHNKIWLINGAKNMRLKDEEKALNYELAVIGYALASEGVLPYDFNGNASAIIRTFLTAKDQNQKSILLPEMALGHQDVNEAFVLFVDKFAPDNYAINLVSELRGKSSYSRKLEQQSNLSVELVGSILKESLDNFFAAENNVFFEGENKLKKFHIEGPFPPLLAITIKRFDVCLKEGRCIKNNNYLSFPLKLDMKEYTKKIDGAPTSDKGTKYELNALIFHVGAIESGHYWAYCKHSLSGIWYRYDNEERREIPIEAMETLKDIGFELLPTQLEATPYMLFYEKSQHQDAA